MENAIEKTAKNFLDKESQLMENGAIMQRMQTKYATAVSVQKPRNLDKIVKNVMREAEFAGEDFFYGWGEGKDHIEGNSVGLALSVVREWGNCAVETDVKEEGKSYIFSAHFIDLETGFTLSRTFRQSKDSVVYGKLDPARKDDIRFQIGQSKAIRNVVNNAMPRWLLNQAREKAKEAVTENITKDGIAISIEKAFKALSKYGVDEARILAKIGVARNQIAMTDVVNLRTAYAAIKNGEATAEEIFPKTENSDRAPAKFAEKKEETKTKTIADALAEIQAPVTEEDVKEYYNSREMTVYPELIIKDIQNVVKNVLEWKDSGKDGKLI